MKKSFPFVLAVLLATPRLSSAQMSPSEGQPDMTMDSRVRAAVVDSLADNMDRFYVFPEKGRSIAHESLYLYLITLAGTPTAVTLSGTSRVTTAPAPMIVQLPIETR